MKEEKILISHDFYTSITDNFNVIYLGNNDSILEVISNIYNIQLEKVENTENFQGKIRIINSDYRIDILKTDYPFWESAVIIYGEKMHTVNNMTQELKNKLRSIYKIAILDLVIKDIQIYPKAKFAVVMLEKDGFLKKLMRILNEFGLKLIGC